MELHFGLDRRHNRIAISSPIAGALVDKTGERALIVFSTIVVAGGYLALSLVGASVAV